MAFFGRKTRENTPKRAVLASTDSSSSGACYVISPNKAIEEDVAVSLREMVNSVDSAETQKENRKQLPGT